MNTVRWIMPLAGAGMLAAASIAGLERTEAFFEPAFESEVAASWEGTVEGVRVPSQAIVVPAGTPVAVLLESAMTSRTAQAGDRFRALVAAPVRVDGQLVIPRGAEVEGHVAASQPGQGPRPGWIQLTYERVRFDDRSYGLNSNSQVYEGAAVDRDGRPVSGPEMNFDAGATLEFELGQAVAMMRDSETS
jgi:hypothetical protein